MECISCIKDAKTGICRDIKDKTAREQLVELTKKLDEVITFVNGITGADAGHLATDEDIKNVNAMIIELQTNIEMLEATLNTYATDEDITALNTKYNELKVTVDSLSGADTSSFATNEDIQTLNNLISELQTSLNNLDSTYAKDSDISSLQEQITTLSTSLNNLDSTYAKDSDITSLQTQINQLDSTYAKDSDISSLQEQITTLSTSLNNLDSTYAKDSDITSLQTQINQLDNTYAKDSDLLDKAIKDFSNVTYPTNTAGSTTNGTADRVIETYISSDGNTWYRRWKSGWKECGQFVASPSSGNATITLPLVFTKVLDAQITVNRTDVDNETIRQVRLTSINYNATSTTMGITNVWVSPTDGSYSTNPYYYCVKGY